MQNMQGASIAIYTLNVNNKNIENRFSDIINWWDLEDRKYICL